MDMLVESAPVLIALALVLLAVCMRPKILQSADAAAEQPLDCKRVVVAVLLIAVAVVGGQQLLGGSSLRF